MGRVVIVLPIYLACMFLAPDLPIYQAFHAAVLESGLRAWQLWAFGAGLGIAVVGTLIIEFMIRPDYGFGLNSFWRILRMGLIGLIVTCTYQLFAFFTARDLSVLILLTPLIFVAAETVFEIIDYMIDLARRPREDDGCDLHD